MGGLWLPKPASLASPRIRPASTGLIGPRKRAKVASSWARGGPSFPGFIEAINPWGYFQLADVPAPAALDIGLDAYWAYSDGAGASVADETGDGNTGTFGGTLGGQWANPGVGTFNGTDNYVGTGLGQSVPMSFECILKATGFGCIFGPNLTGPGHALALFGGAGALQALSFARSGPYVTGATSLVAGVSYHVGFSFDGSTIKLYVDGVLDGTGGWGDSPISGGQNILMGAAYGQWVSTLYNMLTGQISKAGKWSRILSALEFASLAAGAAPTLPLPAWVAVDSASPTQMTPHGHNWGSFPQPPPNNETYNRNVLKVPGLLSDSRTAVSGPGAVSSVTWSYYADAPMCATGWWIATHINLGTLGAETGPSTGVQLWVIPIQLGYHVIAYMQNDGAGHDQIGLTEDYDWSGAVWNFATGTLAGKHEIIIRTTRGTNPTCTLWLDGADQGDRAAGSLVYNFLSQGFQVGGSQEPDSVITHQDVVIMPLGDSPGTDMSDALASGFFAAWESHGG
jgi:hypothetical protein